MRTKNLWIVLLILAMGIMLYSLIQEHWPHDLGSNNQMTAVEIGNQAKFEIKDFPTWNFKRIRVNLSAVDQPLFGAVELGSHRDTLHGHWFKSLSIETSERQSVSLKIENLRRDGAKLQIQWWVEQ